MSTQMSNQAGVQSSDKKIVSLDKNNAYYLVYIISLSLLALGFLLAFLFNLVLGGDGVAVSTMIKSTLGHVIRALIYVPILVAVGFAVYSGWRMFTKKNDKLVADTKALYYVPAVLSYFAIYSFIVSVFIAFLSIVKSNYLRIDGILDFLGYDNIDIFLSMVDAEAETVGFGETIVAVLFGLVFVAYALGMIFVYSKLKSYLNSLSNVALRGNYEIESKPPFIILFVFAGLNVAIAVFSIMSGNWITAIINVAIAAYFTSSAFLFRKAHTYLSNQ